MTARAALKCGRKAKVPENAAFSSRSLEEAAPGEGDATLALADGFSLRETQVTETPMTRHHTDQDDKRHFTHGTAASTADMAADGEIRKEDKSFDAPHAREADRPLQEGEKHDQLAAKVETAENRQEALLDEGLEESFPGSDPVSVKRIT